MGNGHQRSHATRSHEVTDSSFHLSIDSTIDSLISSSILSSFLPFFLSSFLPFFLSSFLLLLLYLFYSLFLIRSVPRFNSILHVFAFFISSSHSFHPFHIRYSITASSILPFPSLSSLLFSPRFCARSCTSLTTINMH